LQGDETVQLVVLCAEKPTSAVLKRVVNELPIQLKKIGEDAKYTVTMAPVEGAVLVSDGVITVKVSLTSPLLREPAGKFHCEVQFNEFLSEHEKFLTILSYQFHLTNSLSVIKLHNTFISHIYLTTIIAFILKMIICFGR
jgi:hypothetical protein